MEAAERDQQLRAALFRLVDVTPACRSLDDLAEPLTGYREEVDERPTTIEAAMRMAGSRPGRKALGAAAAAGVRHMAHRFIVGESARGALKPIGELWAAGIASSVDLLGEATVTEDEAERYAGRCREMLETLSAGAAGWPVRPLLERDSIGPIARVNVSVKVTALTPHMRPEAPAVGREDAARRLGPLLRIARDLGAHLHVDMESVDSLETTEELLFALLDEPGLREGPSVGLVLQAYLRESPTVLEHVLAWAERADRAQPLVVRLVKGAYWDHEGGEARQAGSPARGGLGPGWPGAPTGARGGWSPASTAGARRCSSPRPTATATSRRSPSGCSRLGRWCAWRSPPTTCARWPTPSLPTGRS